MPKSFDREQLEFTIERTEKRTWEYYKKYHYLNDSVGTGHYYEMKLKGKKVGFIAIARFPHPKAKDIMTISRVVVVPEFQGFGIGIKFMNVIAEIYKTDRVRITTSLKPFMKALDDAKKWKLVRFGRVHCSSGNGFQNRNKKGATVSTERITATFQFNKDVSHGPPKKEH